MNSLTKETKLTIFYILIAFAFSVLMRMIWVYQFGGYEPFMHNGEFMINTNDGYLWAEGARDILSKTVINPDAANYLDRFHQPNDLSPVDSAPAKLTAFFATVLPFSFESIIFYLPVFLSSLVVIPIILIAKNLKNLEMGLIAALLASIAWSYYNRTMIGYYDTDMLNIVLPVFLLWSIIWAINTNEEKYLLITAIDILAYRWWYPQSYSLEFSFFGLILLYTLIFDRKNLYNYKLLAIMMFAMMNLGGFVRFPVVLAAFYIFKGQKYDKYIYYILGLAIATFFISGGFNPVFGQLKKYVFTDSLRLTEDGMKLHFYSLIQTVREAGHIPFETFANRISGHSVTFLLSLVGYVWLSYKHRVMLFALPMVGLGFLAYFGGLRFTIYAVPVMAMGIAFLITESTRYITDKKSVTYLSYIVLTISILFPNYKHLDGYKVPTVFNSDEVEVLEELKLKADREDYVIAWWDYGFPIRYYGDLKTLVDGGKNTGDVNFPVSFILTHPQEQAAKLARLDVEYTEKSFKTSQASSNIEQMTKDYGFDDTNDFLLSLQTDIKLPKKTRDIYLYLPFRMLDIYPTVVKFSNLDLMDGMRKTAPFYFVSRRFKETKESVLLGNGIVFDKANSTVKIQNQTLSLKRVVQTYYDKDMKLHKDTKLIDFGGKLNLIYMSAYKTFLLIDEKTYNSLYIQLMVLEEYDKNLFEQVIINPHAKVYKLK